MLLAPLVLAWPTGSRSILPAWVVAGQAQTSGSGLTFCASLAWAQFPLIRGLTVNIGKPVIRQRRKSTKSRKDASIQSLWDNRASGPPISAWQTGGKNMPARAVHGPSDRLVDGGEPSFSRFPPGKRASRWRGCTVAAHVSRMLVSYPHHDLLEKLWPVASFPQVNGAVPPPQRPPSRPVVPVICRIATVVVVAQESKSRLVTQATKLEE